MAAGLQTSVRVPAGTGALRELEAVGRSGRGLQFSYIHDDSPAERRDETWPL